MVAATAQAQGGDAKALVWARPYLPMLQSWADYLVKSLPDPGNQLCTDDFEGPSPHNVNLAAKGIVALEAFAGLLEAKSKCSEALLYRQLAKALAFRWTS